MLESDLSEFFYYALSNSYFYVALGATLFFVLQSIFTFLGIGDNFELDADFDADIDIDVGALDGLSMTFHLFTIRGIISFFMIFGWSGFILTDAGYGDLLTLLVSFGTGIIMLLLVALVYYFFKRIEQDGNMILKDAIGKQGMVYIPIPKRNEGLGKVQIIVGSSLRTLDAISTSEPIKTGTQVKVIGIINEMLEVEEI
jgi:membrane-bound ClpP family serine protease